MDPLPDFASVIGDAVTSGWRTGSYLSLAPPHKGRVHKNRSAMFVRALEERLGEHYGYGNNNDIIVLSSAKWGERVRGRMRQMFGVQELLYDVVVCRMAGNMEGIASHARMIEAALCQVESEFARLRDAVVYDFNKLMLGSAKHQLFIASRGPKIKGLLQRLARRSAEVRSRDGICLCIFAIDHPDLWQSGNPPRVERLVVEEDQWEEVRVEAILPRSASQEVDARGI